MAGLEYWTGFVYLDSDGIDSAGGENPWLKSYLKNYRSLKGRYDPKYLAAWLNMKAAQGWELEHLEPVGSVGQEGDWKSPHRDKYNMGESSWIRNYFVILKRRVGEA